MITSLLIANRGEITCRIMRTCRELGVRTVAVYSDADAKAKHVREADEAVRIGPPPAAESYLVGDAIIAAAKETGAEAIHPGYGFLSENADFAEAVIAAGLIWVGPKPETIRAMGLKDEAKRIAEEAGVPVLPGYRGEAQDVETLKTAAEEIGFPLLIKAVAGGGGRGIREVRALDELEGQLESAQREAKSAFGDDRVMLEKLVERPRHIEVQVFGDSHGNVVHLFERDCSLQRRRQKVIEEAPAPNMPEDVRAAMTSAAVRLAEKVGYENAGTVEFIVDGSGPLTLESFWFLEMNTRLQVEHPVTELITGQDLVEWQLRVASGEALPLKQDEITMTGHAIEARICAEDPANDFMPSVGRLEAFHSYNDVRLDTGFEAGDTIPPTYDSMIAKLIVSGPDRDGAISAMKSALGEARIFPQKTNMGFMFRALTDTEFAAGTHSVNHVAERYDALTTIPDAKIDEADQQALRAIHPDVDYEEDPWSVSDGFRLNAESVRRFAFQRDGEVVSLEFSATGQSEPFSATFLSNERVGVNLDGDTFVYGPPTFESAIEALEAGDDIKAPMPGKLLSLKAEVGANVSKGDTLAVMEAMKMEHSLTAPRDGVIAEVHGEAGQQLSEGVLIVRLAPEE